MCALTRAIMAHALEMHPHDPRREQPPLELPAGSELNLWPACMHMPEAVSFWLVDQVARFLSEGDALDYRLQGLSRGHWRCMSRRRPPRCMSWWTRSLGIIN